MRIHSGAVAKAMFLTWPLLSACETITGATACTTEARPALVVEVRDSVSGQSVIGGTTLVVSSRTYQEQQSYPDPTPASVTAYYVAHERKGFFQITVRKPGYADWHGAALVRPGECHVQTERVVAKVQRAGAT